MTEARKVVDGGYLIAFEGVDGSGKTTMAKMIVDRLQLDGYEAVYLREPTDGVHGRKLREIMVSGETRDPRKEFDLFILDRMEDVERNIRPVMERGSVVCIDRYYISSMAYQGALGLDVQMIKEENEKFAPVPDLILRYQVSIDTALSRIVASRKDGANQFEKRDNLERVDREFNRMSFPQMVNVDAEKPLADLFKNTWDIISDRLK